MTKVTINKEKPVASAIQQMTSKANDVHVVTDKAGRALKIKRPDFLAQFRLTKALGDSAANSMYHRMVFPILYLVAIDDVDIFPPKDEKEVELIIKQLDEHGYAALNEGIEAHFAEANEDERETAKN